MSAVEQPNRATGYFEDYQAYHHHPTNALTHFVGIPIIVVTIAGLLSWISIGPSFVGGAFGIDAGLLLWLIVSAFYIWIDWRLGTSFSLVVLGCYVVGRQLMYSEYWWSLWILFVVGWALQFIGHYQFEKKSPAFFKNIEHLLIGPFWIFAKAVGHYRQSSRA